MSRDTKIKDVKIIRTNVGEIENELEHFEYVGTEGCVPKNREEIKWYADEPCVEACQKLYDLNIRTYSSSGHVNGEENATGIAYIAIDYNSLSDENKEVVLKLLNDGQIKELYETDSRNHCYSFHIETTIHSDMTVGEVSDRLLEMANNFHQQDVLYGMATYEELKSDYFPKQEDGNYRDELLAQIISEEEANERFDEYLESGLLRYYTDDGDNYYMSSDLLRKHNEYVNSLNHSRTR